MTARTRHRCTVCDRPLKAGAGRPCVRGCGARICRSRHAPQCNDVHGGQCDRLNPPEEDHDMNAVEGELAVERRLDDVIERH